MPSDLGATRTQVWLISRQMKKGATVEEIMSILGKSHPDATFEQRMALIEAAQKRNAR